MSLVVLNSQVVEWVDIFANPVFENPCINKGTKIVSRLKKSSEMNEQGQGLQAYPVHLQPNFSSSVSLFPYKGRRFLGRRSSFSRSSFSRYPIWHYAQAQPSRFYFQPNAIFTKEISYVLRGIKRAVARKLVKISDGRLSRHVDRKSTI